MVYGFERIPLKPCQPVSFSSNTFPIALTHHEKYNGSGYPQGLSGSNIPVSGRIVAITDTFDTLTSRRPYKEPYPIDVAADIIRSERGGHFDPEITDIFLDNNEEIREIRETVSRMESVSQADFMWSQRDMQPASIKESHCRSNLLSASFKCHYLLSLL